MKPRIAIILVALVALIVPVVAPAQSQEISISGTLLNGELYTGLSGRINQLTNVLGTKLNLDINAFTVTNPRNGAPAAGFSLTARKQIADNGWLYGGPALKWEQGKRSSLGIAFGLLVTVSGSPSTSPPDTMVVWKRIDGRDSTEVVRIVGKVDLPRASK